MDGFGNPCEALGFRNPCGALLRNIPRDNYFFPPNKIQNYRGQCVKHLLQAFTLSNGLSEVAARLQDPIGFRKMVSRDLM